jgi:hypothetical protein
MEVLCKKILYLPDSLIVLFERDKWYNVSSFNTNGYDIKSGNLKNFDVYFIRHRIEPELSSIHIPMLGGLLFSDYFISLADVRKIKLTNLNKKI